jgi:hypothetical protein
MSSRLSAVSGRKSFSGQGRGDRLAIPPRAATLDEVKGLRRDAGCARKWPAQESVAADGQAARMRYFASERLEIIRLVEEFFLAVRRTLEKSAFRTLLSTAERPRGAYGAPCRLCSPAPLARLWQARSVQVEVDASADEIAAELGAGGRTYDGRTAGPGERTAARHE